MTRKTIQYYDWGEYESWFWPANTGGSGVYVFIDNREVLYVGKTVDLHSRLISHHVITFDYIKRIIRGRSQLLFWPCEEPECSMREAYLIFVLKPPLNRKQPKIELISPEFIPDGEAMLEELKSFHDLRNNAS